MIRHISSAPILSDSANQAQADKLKKACADFESLFLNYLLKSMRSSVSEGGIIDQSEESKIFKSMFDENLAKEIAASGGLGLGDILFEKLMANRFPEYSEG
jgi:flagellar protein FlgJ